MMLALMRRLASLWIVVLMTLTGGVLASCSDSQPAPLLPPNISFLRYQPIFLDVANIDIVEEYKMPQREPFVEHLLPITPAEAVRQWVKDRVRSVGLENTLQVIIRDGRVVGTELPQKEGMTEYFSPGADRQYDARLEVEMRIYTGGGMSEASVTVVSTQSATIPKAATVVERKAAFNALLMQMMEAANAELEKQIFRYFTRFIIYAQTP